ncbi:MAG: C1 family peptidase [Petrotogales bacterium]
MKKAVTFLILILLLASIIPISAEKPDYGMEQCDLPFYFSWRNINGTDYTTPIKDQSPAPTCEAYALCASLETLMQYKVGEPYAPDVSETHLYFYAGGTYEAGYVNLIDAANYLMEYGVPDEGCYPDPHRAFDYPFESLPGWENRTVKIQKWGWVEHDVEAIKSALVEHGPLIVCIYFWRDFYYYRGGVYEHRWGRRVGGHVVTIVGYDDINECWIVKNSWGTKWGENGWFRMSYHADMFAEWYGEGTGVMYIDGIYGNLKPDVPIVQIEKPIFLHTYMLDREFPTIFNKLPLQKAAARIFGNLEVEVTAENTNTVEFYIDDVSHHIDDEAPFTWVLQATRGLHTLEVRATNDHNTSIDIVDFYIFI